ncbi:MAG: dTMP kinase [Planctomycetota bacterium]
MAEGLFIALEGIDGAGTTTQAQRLAAWLTGQGRAAVLTAEPTPRPVGGLIRQILQGRLVDLGGQPVEVDETTMALLFAADRADHLASVVLPAVEAGKIVVSDRHYLSSVAYQSLGVDMAWVESLNARFRRPDLTVLLDIAPETSLRRKAAQGAAAERYERLEALEAVRRNYLAAADHARARGERVEVLDGDEAAEVVATAIQDRVQVLLGSE